MLRPRLAQLDIGKPHCGRGRRHTTPTRYTRDVAPDIRKAFTVDGRQAAQPQGEDLHGGTVDDVSKVRWLGAEGGCLVVYPDRFGVKLL